MKSWLLKALVSSMLLTGTLNTLLNKYQDMTCVEYCNDPAKRKNFEQPLLQTLNMFVGELMCLVVYVVEKWWAKKSASIIEEENEPLLDQGIEETLDLSTQYQDTVSITTAEIQPITMSKYILFLIPTLLDLTATTLMNIGLIFISASVYQMLRGSVSIFTAIFTRLIVGTKHQVYKWVSLILVFIGVSVVGYSGMMGSSNVQVSPLGIFLVVLAQQFTALQFVFEEIVLSKYATDPTLAVGLEGFFGTVILMIAIPILHLTLATKYEIFNIYTMFNSD